MRRACCILVFAIWALLGLDSALAVGPGDPAPDFTLQDVNGSSHSLSDYSGKVILLAFVGYG